MRNAPEKKKKNCRRCKCKEPVGHLHFFYFGPSMANPSASFAFAHSQPENMPLPNIEQIPSMVP